MRAPARFWRPRLRAPGWTRREDGASTLPAMLFLPFFLMVFFSSVEMSVMMLKQVLLERGVSLTARILQLGIADFPTEAQLKSSICKNVAFISDCSTNLRVQLFEVDKGTWTTTSTTSTPNCVDKSLATQPTPTLDRGAENQLVLMRVCLLSKLMMPTSGLGAAIGDPATGRIALVANTAFVNEPRSNGGE